MAWKCLVLLPLFLKTCSAASNGTCSAPHTTGGTCRVLGCFSSRGPATCISGSCCCQKGYHIHESTTTAQSHAEEIFASAFAELFAESLLQGSSPLMAAFTASSSASRRAAAAFSDEAGYACWPTVATLQQLQSRLRSAPANYSSDTGGRCRTQGCYLWRQHSYCSGFPWYQCLCKPGARSVDGVCVYAGKNYTDHKSDTLQSIAITGGHCTIFGCDSWRGPTHCDASTDYNCVCNPGNFSLDGICVPIRGSAAFNRTSDAMNHTCNRNTEGTCRVFGCFQSRGPTICQSGECLCQEGYCTQSSSSVAQTAAVAAAAESFAKSFGKGVLRLGAKAAYSGIFALPFLYRMARKAGVGAGQAGADAFYSKNLACMPTNDTYLCNQFWVCTRDTTGSCWMQNCYAWRGNSSCSGWPYHKCICPEGFCAINGACVDCKGQGYAATIKSADLSITELVQLSITAHLPLAEYFGISSLLVMVLLFISALCCRIGCSRYRRQAQVQGQLGQALLVSE